MKINSGNPERSFEFSDDAICAISNQTQFIRSMVKFSLKLGISLNRWSALSQQTPSKDANMKKPWATSRCQQRWQGTWKTPCRILWQKKKMAQWCIGRSLTEEYSLNLMNLFFRMHFFQVATFQVSLRFSS